MVTDVRLADLTDEDMQQHQQTTLWIYLYRCSKLGPRSLWLKQSSYTMEEQTRSICDLAVRHRMTRASIDHSSIKSPKLFSRPSKQVMDSVNNMIDILVSTNPDLYSDITIKLNIPVQDERTVCRTYSEFAENLFRKGVTWPLIISLLAFSGSLAAECTRNGRSILVRKICDWATLFIVMRLKEWIHQHGGWDGISTFFNNNTSSTATSKLSLLKPAEKFIQFDLLQQHISAINVEKSVRIFLMLLIFFLLLLLSYFKNKMSISENCHSNNLLNLG